MHGKNGKKGGVCDWCRTPLVKGHAKACCLWFAGELFFLLGVAALIAAWVTHARGTTWLGFSSEHLFHDATAFLVLAMIFKLKKHGYKRWLIGGSCCAAGCCPGGCGAGCCPEGCGEGKCACGPEAGKGGCGACGCGPGGCGDGKCACGPGGCGSGGGGCC